MENNNQEKIENTGNTEKKVKGKNLFKKGYDPRRNLEGRPLGAKNFTTIFRDAIKKIAKEKNLKGCDVEVDLVVRAIAEARSGNYQYYKDIFDRVYGKALETVRLGAEEESIARFEEMMRELSFNKGEKKDDRRR